MNRFSVTTAAVAAISLMPTTSAFAARKPDLESYIPADSPYVFSMEEQMPDALLDKIEPVIDETLKGYQTILRHVMAEQLVKMSEDAESDRDPQKFRALMEEVLGLMSLEGIRGAGIERDSRIAFYGNGLTPVVRIELSNVDLFNAAIARLEERAEKAMPTAKTGGTEYRYAEFETLRLIVATIDGQAVITLTPNDYNDAQMALALGIEKPARSLARARTLRDIQKEYGFEKYITGYFDIVRLADTFVNGPQGIDRQLFEAFEYTPTELSAACQSEVMEMAGIAPRMVFGYDDVSASSYDALFAVELREDIAAGLATLPAAFPGLGRDFGGLLSFGISMNPMMLREFIEARLDAMEADPYECELFSEMQNGVAKAREALAQPVPPVVYGFRGLLANFNSFEGFDIEEGTAPESLENVDASMLLAVENAEALLMMATMMSPEVAALNLMPDGTPVEVEIPQLAEFGTRAFAAMSENALSVSFGGDAENAVGELLDADSADPAPFVSMSMDAKQYYRLIVEAMEKEAASAKGEDAGVMGEVMQTSMRDMMLATAELYDRMLMDVDFTGRGIEMDVRVTLSE